ncbi:nucleoside phosphorylase [Streptomyces sp. NPDC002896]|uniref:nucleoside phosphorylase n=1 Tax=Streptomyces sp. NPDC002896 TaxID=3154438 RepID=UPI00331ADD62
MAFPNLPGKHALPALFQPHEAPHHALRKQAGLPAGVVIMYSARLKREVLERHESRRIEGFFGECHLVKVEGGQVGLLSGFGIGGPAAASVLEEAIAAGARRVISIGGAGGLRASQVPGDLVVCDRAVRDEGVSHHYLAPARYVRPDEELTARLIEALKERGRQVQVGGSWTTDAIYRETRQEMLTYRDEGVLTVEMEAASLAAVAQYRGVAFATGLVVMDSLAEESWEPKGLADAAAFGALNDLFDAAAAVLAGG